MFDKVLRWLRSFKWQTLKELKEHPGTVATIVGSLSLSAGLTALWKYYETYRLFFSHYFQIRQAGVDSATIVKSGVEYIFSLISNALEKATISSSSAEGDFVRRSQFESILKVIVENKMPVRYQIVYGPRGAGKSELVNHSVINLPAVKIFKITSARSREELVTSVMFQLTGEKTNLDAATFEEALKTFIRGKNVIPTFIFDVERGSDVSPETYKTLRAFAKDLVRKCRCIIVLSEAAAVLEFSGDPDRESFIYVKEMSELEAEELLKKQRAPFTEEERRYIYDNVGTRPGMLISIVDEVKSFRKSVKECVDQIVKAAANDLKNFPLKPILVALKDHPDGVSIDHFENQMCGNVNLFDAREVGSVMRARAESNPLVFRKELREYQLLSTAHKTALKAYDPALSISCL